jgi:hypothetical protein
MANEGKNRNQPLASTNQIKFVVTNLDIINGAFWWTPWSTAVIRRLGDGQNGLRVFERWRRIVWFDAIWFETDQLMNIRMLNACSESWKSALMSFERNNIFGIGLTWNE